MSSIVRLALLALAVAALAAAAPSSSDNAYPVRPSGTKTDKYDAPKYDAKPKYGDDTYADVMPKYEAKPTEPCTTSAKPKPTATSTPCTSSYAKPTYTPDEGALSRNQDRSPVQQERPQCPAPITITRTAAPRTETVTATRTQHDTRTVTRTEFATVTATVTKVKPVVSVSIKERVREVTTTCHVTTTVQEYVTKVRTVKDYKTVTVTRSAAALPTQASRPKDSAYGEVKPYTPEEKPAYGPVKPCSSCHDGDVKGDKYDREEKYDDKPTYMPTQAADSEYY